MAVMWLHMDVSLSLVTVMIGSILVGVDVDFSIHIITVYADRWWSTMHTSAVTGMSLFEAAAYTLGKWYRIPDSVPEKLNRSSLLIIDNFLDCSSKCTDFATGNFHILEG